jgi:hypothetical protein
MFEKLFAFIAPEDDSVVNRNTCGLRQRVVTVVCAVYGHKIHYLLLSLNCLKDDQVLDHVSAEYHCTPACSN